MLFRSRDFGGYAVVSRTEIADAMRKLQESGESSLTQNSHEMVPQAKSGIQTLQ